MRFYICSVSEWKKGRQKKKVWFGGEVKRRYWLSV